MATGASRFGDALTVDDVGGVGVGGAQIIALFQLHPGTLSRPATRHADQKNQHQPIGK